MAPPKPKHEINISHEAFEEFTNALNEAGVKLDKNDEILIKPDMSIKGPILYRQVNLRHQILMEVVKVYKSPMIDEIEINDVNDFLNYLDAIYSYVLTGEKPASPEKKTATITELNTKPKGTW